jgi:polar amino acid transport system substrate-binding protein
MTDQTPPTGGGTPPEPAAPEPAPEPAAEPPAAEPAAEPPAAEPAAPEPAVAAAPPATPAAPPPPPPTAPVAATTTGGRNNHTIGLLVIAVVAIVAIAAILFLNNQGEPGASPSPEASPSAPASAEASPSPDASPSPEPSPSPSPDACAPENLAVKTAGVLTLGTDNPAYPPYFEAGDGPFTAPWEDLGYTGDPGSGKGFESAVAYAVAEELGFTAEQVTWIVVPFANAYAPGPKAFDFVINQVSYTPERAEQVVALKDNAAATATTVADLKGYRFGAQVGTTSYAAIVDVIQPTTAPSVYDTNDAAIEALKAGQIDAIVVDLPTSDFITRVQIDDGSATIVGQLEPIGGTPEYFSLVIEKDSAFTPCVNAAIGALDEDGTLDALATEWLPFQEDVPVLK